MTTEITTVEKISKLSWSISSNALTNAFLQLTAMGSVFILFLNTLGLSKNEIGFLLSLLPFMGLISIFIGPVISRYGYKRTLILFSGIRIFTAALLLLTPWVVKSYGLSTTLLFISVAVTLFALARAMVITAYYPWVQEYVPNSIQGKYSANNNLFITLAGFMAVTVGSFVIDLAPGLTGFMFLIILGIVIGTLALWFLTHIPGGAPVDDHRPVAALLGDLAGALRDRDMRFFLAGVGLITLATVPLTTFVPLFLQEQIGLSSGNVILVQNGVLFGGLLSTYLWGWSADRYGSRPVMLLGIAILVLLPVLWIVMPRESELSLPAALAIAFLQGLADMGWVIGSTRLLFVSIVVPEKRGEYTSLYYACLSLFGGASTLLGGQLVTASAGWAGEFWLFRLDPYTGLFGLSIFLAALSVFTLRRVRSDTKMTVEEFAGMFLHGNPFMAMTSLVGYHLARDESKVIAATERLGETRSPFTVDELLEVLEDPRFNVRYEAVISIARTRPHPRLTEALIAVFNGTELSLTNLAAWALGRVGDRSAIAPLRQGLDSPYHSIRASSARALGRLRARELAPLLLDTLRQEQDKGLQMAYASALGNLGAVEAVDTILPLLFVTQNRGARRELALSLARLVGNEGHFIHLHRNSRTDLPTTAAQAVSSLKARLVKSGEASPELLQLVAACSDRLAHNQLVESAPLLCHLLERLPAGRFKPHAWAILGESARRWVEGSATRTEYLLLALHTLEEGWK
jgi:MFS family permease